MTNYFKKVKHILPIYLLAVFLSIFLLFFLRYVFDFKFSSFEVKVKNWEFFFPIIFSVISIILIRKRFWILKHTDKSKDTFIYIFLCWIVSFVLHINSQSFFTNYFSKTQIVDNVEMVSKENAVKKIKIKKFFIDPFYSNFKTQTNATGKNNDKLLFTFYYTSAIVKDTLTRDDKHYPKVWYVNTFSETISNNLSNEEKYRKFLEFRNKASEKISKTNYFAIDYFEKLPNSNEKELYISLISTLVGKNLKEEIILLTPSKKDFNDKGEKSMKFFLGFFIGGISLILFSLFFPKYRNPKTINFKKEGDLELVTKFLIPTKDFLITPIIIDINLLIYLVICIIGVDPINPSFIDMIKFGALTPQVAHGEFWRLITSMFLHAGIMHLLMNMVVLAIAGTFAEGIFGKLKFSILYFFAGILSMLTSLLWHENMIGVGASGAIFGVIGATAMIIILTQTWKESQTVLLIIFAYVAYNLFTGMFSNVDNVAHISGLIFGAIFSLILHYYKE